MPRAGSPTAGARCAHARWEDLPVPGERPGRFFRCADCGACGYRKPKFGGGGGRVFPLQCSHGAGACRAEATARLYGRSHGGGFRWACADHAPKADAKALPGDVGQRGI